MVLRAVAVGFALVAPLGCARSAPVLAPTVILVEGVSGGEVGVGSEPPVAEAPSRWNPQDEVEVEWRGTWYPAVVLEKRGPDRWLVHYEGYTAEWDEVVGGDRIRERRVEPEGEDPDEDEDEADP